MLRTIRSNATHGNERFARRQRRGRENNLAWVQRELPPEGDRTIILLLGSRDAAAVRVRVAQSHVRHDLTPSAWSHAALLGRLNRDDIGATPLYEASLDPGRGFGFPPPSNGIQETALARYRDPGKHPNIAFVAVPVPLTSTEQTLARLRTQRAMLDIPELIVAWLAFVWGVGRAGNPLFDGLGIPGAAMLETLLAAGGPDAFELTPGLASRSSCPEAIFQAALYWHDYYAATATEAGTSAAARVPFGAWCITHDLCLDPE
jgi:hypothetical protein